MCLWFSVSLGCKIRSNLGEMCGVWRGRVDNNNKIKKSVPRSSQHKYTLNWVQRRMNISRVCVCVCRKSGDGGKYKKKVCATNLSHSLHIIVKPYLFIALVSPIHQCRTLYSLQSPMALIQKRGARM